MTSRRDCRMRPQEADSGHDELGEHMQCDEASGARG